MTPRNRALDSNESSFDKVVAEAMKRMQYWSQNAWRYEYVVHRNGGEVIVRLEKVR